MSKWISYCIQSHEFWIQLFPSLDPGPRASVIVCGSSHRIRPPRERSENYFLFNVLNKILLFAPTASCQIVPSTFNGGCCVPAVRHSLSSRESGLIETLVYQFSVVNGYKNCNEFGIETPWPSLSEVHESNAEGPGAPSWKCPSSKIWRSKCARPYPPLSAR